MEDDMKLPEGKVCGDCRNFKQCKSMIGSLKPGNIECDFAPSRFVESESSRSPALLCGDMWEAYGPSRTSQTFDTESSVGPTDINDVCGPLCVVSGDTPEESIANAKRIADLLNKHGLQDT